jgi:glycine oxidase
VQVVVVGAGVVGYAIAYELASRGAQVRVVDQRGSGQGATHASAGILAPYIEGHSRTLLRLGVCSLEQYDAFVARVARDAGRLVEYARNGTLQVAVDDAEIHDLDEQRRALVTGGISHSFIDADEARRLEPNLTADVRAALMIAQHGYVHVPALVSALVEGAARYGARLSVGHVEGVDADRGSLKVATTEERMVADAVVMAAGSWSGGIPTGSAPAPPVRPVRGQLVQLRRAQPTISTVVWGHACYLVPWRDGSVLVGATVEDAGFDESVTADGVRHLLQSGERLVPALRSAVFTGARAGLRPAASDELPIIGPSTAVPGLYYATAHYRNGVLLAPLTAMLIADLLINDHLRPELELVRPGRFGL